MMMANFRLEDYETVEERLRRFYGLHPDGRVITYDYTTPEERAKGYWKVRTEVFLNAGDQALGLVKSSGLASEIDGQGMTQKTSALETCETSSIGRALANMNLSGNKRASREEMEKVARGVKPKNVVVPDGFVDRVNEADLEALKLLWADAVAGGFSVEVQDVVTKRKGALT
jgi:hypothetical protein